MGRLRKSKWFPIFWYCRMCNKVGFVDTHQICTECWGVVVKINFYGGDKNAKKKL
jgi:hypothetical protein